MSIVDRTDPVSRLVRRGPVNVEPTATLREVSDTLVREEVGVALVVHDGNTVGLISERDVVRALAHDADPDDERAEDVMVFEVVDVTPRESVAEAAARMLEGQIRHLLVKDGERVVGVVSMRDLLAACAG